MVKVGLTPMEAIVAATSSSARLLRREQELGTVQTGRLADMVLLDANPLQDIMNTRRINAVVVNGRLMDRRMLDDLLAQMAAANATN
jgi:imidazolonepropionase-like amidohydrolase